MGVIIICTCISMFIVIHNKLISISSHKGFDDSKYDFLYHYLHLELGFKGLKMPNTTFHCKKGEQALQLH
jgi:hypothetical protein